MVWKLTGEELEWTTLLHRELIHQLLEYIWENQHIVGGPMDTEVEVVEVVRTAALRPHITARAAIQDPVHVPTLLVVIEWSPIDTYTKTFKIRLVS